MNLIHLAKSVFKKYTLLRAYENALASTISLQGAGLDLGAKSTDAKYYPYLDMTQVDKIDFVDYYHEAPGILKVDLEKPLPIGSEQYDFIICFNVLEHIYKYEQLFREMNRVLKAGGRLHAFVPLMWHFHPDPNDYFRFTGQAIERIARDSGFADVSVTAVAAGPFKVAASQIAGIVRIRMLVFPIYLGAVWADRLHRHFSRGSDAYALAYYFTAQK